jgi:hypothetical protein
VEAARGLSYCLLVEGHSAHWMRTLKWRQCSHLMRTTLCLFAQFVFVASSNTCFLTTPELESCIDEFEVIRTKGLGSCEHDLLTCEAGGVYKTPQCKVRWNMFS